MADYGLDADAITRWVLRKEYRLYRPTPEQISQYRYWHHVSRTRGFAAAGPWETWPSKPIADGAVAPEPKPSPEPASSPVNGGAVEHHEQPRRRRVSKRSGVVRGDEAAEPGGNGHQQPRRRRGGYPRGAPERARTLLRARLAAGPQPGAAIEADAVALAIPKRSLLVAADALNVRCRRGQWWLAG